MSAPSQPEAALAQQIANVLALSYNEGSIKHSLGILDTLESDSLTERSIRNSVEVNLLSKVAQVLTEFRPVYTEIKALEQSVETFGKKYETISQTLQSSSKAFTPVLKEAKFIEKEKITLRNKLATATAFKDSFIVSDEEIDILTNSSLPVDEKFYSTLEKVEQIQKDCSSILAESPSLGEDLLTQVTKYLSQAQDKLRYHTEKRLRDYLKSLDDVPAPPPKDLKRDLQLLSSEPIIFRGVLTSVGDIRKKSLVAEFSRLKLLNNDEPARLVGSLCAWVHSATINEYEMLSSLLKANSSEDFNFSATSLTLFASDSTEELVYELTDATMSCIEPTFRQRLSQLISTQDRIINLDEIHNILDFYREIFEKHKLKSLVNTMDQVYGSLKTQFDHLLLMQLEYAKKSKPKVSKELDVPEFLISILSTCRTLLENYQNSMNYQPLGDDYIRGCINSSIDPFLDLCKKIADGLGPYDKHVFLLNCLDPINMQFSGYIFANFKLDEIEKHINEHIDLLADLEFRKMSEESGLAAAVEGGEKQKFYEKLNEYLIMFDSGYRLHLIKSPSVISAVRRKAAEKFIEKYEEVIDEKATKSVEDIRLLLL